MQRRKVIGLAGAGVVGAATAGAVAWRATGGEAGPAAPAPDRISFYGERQAGIITPAQDRLHFVAFDVITKDRAALINMLESWTAAAARMAQGKEAGALGAVGGLPEAPPEDTGEALGLPAADLTLT